MKFQEILIETTFDFKEIRWILLLKRLLSSVWEIIYPEATGTNNLIYFYSRLKVTVLSASFINPVSYNLL